MTRIHLHDDPNRFVYQHPQTQEHPAFDVRFSLNDLPTFSQLTRELIVSILKERFDPIIEGLSETEQAAINTFLAERKILPLAQAKADSDYQSLVQLRDDAVKLQQIGEPSLLKTVATSTLLTVATSSAALLAVFNWDYLFKEGFESPDRRHVATGLAVVSATEILKASWQGYKASSKDFEHYATKMEETLDKERSFLEHNGPHLINRIGQLIANVEGTVSRDNLHKQTSVDHENYKKAKVEIINALNFHRKLQAYRPITSQEAIEKGMWVEETVATQNDRVVDGELKENANLPAYGDNNWSCAIL